MEYWKFVDGEGNTLAVESHSFPHQVPDAIQITKEEYDEFIASLPPPEPSPENTGGYVHPKYTRFEGSIYERFDAMEDFLESL